MYSVPPSYNTPMSSSSSASDGYKRQLLKLALNGHMLLMLGATALAGYHGWLMAQSEGWLEGDSLSGLLALAMMAYLSVAGVLLWRRLPPDWVSRSLRKRARLAHVQRGVTVLLLVALALHLG